MTILLTAPPLYVLDTSILVHYIRDDALGQRIETTYSLLTTPTTPLISIVTEGEIRSLAIRRGWGPTRLRRLESWLGRFVSVPLSRPGLIEAYAVIDAHSQSTGRAMGKNDVWIAATAHVTDAILLTTDLDFEHLHPTFLERAWIDGSA